MRNNILRLQKKKINKYNDIRFIKIGIYWKEGKYYLII